MESIATCHLDFAREWRGGQRQVYLLTSGLAERGHPTYLITRPGTPLAERLRDSAVQVIEMRILSEFDVTSFYNIARFIKKKNIPILAAHASQPHGLALWVRRFAPQTKVVVHRRVDVPLRKGRAKYLAPDRYIAISEAVQKVLLEGSVPAEKIRVVSSGVPPHSHDPQAKERLAKERNLPADADWVGNIADLVEHKGQANLIDAWPIVLAARPQAQLVIIGEGELRKKLEQRIRELGIDDSVHLIGRRDDIPAWLSALSVFVMSSISEGLGTSILDAMAARVPVVGTNVGGIPELVRDGETGRLVSAGDQAAFASAIVGALTDSAQRETCTQSAFAMVQNERSAERMIEATLSVYRELASE